MNVGYRLMLFIILLSPIQSFCQLPEQSQKFVTVDASFSALDLKFDKQPTGKNLALGFRIGVSRFLIINPKVEVFFNVSFAQYGTRYFRVYATGVIDTNNVFNSLRIFREEEKLNYLNGKIGLRKQFFSNRSLQAYLGFNTFGGYMISAKYKGKELSGLGVYNTNAISLFHKLNWGIEPTVTLRVNMLNGSYFFVTGSYEVGISNILARSQTFANSERTKAYNITLSFPVF